MPSKLAIFDPVAVQSIRDAAQTLTERVVVGLMLETGIHPKDLIGLDSLNLTDGWLQWKRAKNSRPRRELLPSDLAKDLERWLRYKGRPRSRVQIWRIVKSIGDRVGIPGLCPMSLRHTFCIMLLRQYHGHPDRMLLTAHRMGCSIEVVAQSYLDLYQWEATP